MGLFVPVGTIGTVDYNSDSSTKYIFFRNYNFVLDRDSYPHDLNDFGFEGVIIVSCYLNYKITHRCK